VTFYAAVRALASTDRSNTDHDMPLAGRNVISEPSSFVTNLKFSADSLESSVLYLSSSEDSTDYISNSVGIPCETKLTMDFSIVLVCICTLYKQAEKASTESLELVYSAFLFSSCTLVLAFFFTNCTYPFTFLPVILVDRAKTVKAKEFEASG